MPDGSQQHEEGSRPPSFPRCARLDEVTEPGAYISKGTGDLVRIVQRGAFLEGKELLNRHDDEPVYVARISNDPFIPISQARLAAANSDITINF